MKRKMTFRDKLNVLANKPQYIKEYRELSRGSSSSLSFFERTFSHEHALKNEGLKKRWGLVNVIGPNDIKDMLKKITEKDTGEGIFTEDREMVEVIPYSKPWSRDSAYLDLSRHLQDKKYLKLKINITAEETKILEAIKEDIRFYRSRIKFIPQRAKPSKGLDHWEIYRKIHREGKTALQIAKEYYSRGNQSGQPKKPPGGSTHPAYNEEVKSIQKQVVRAERKAQEMIDQVEPVNVE